MAKGCLAKTSQGNHNEVNEYVSDKNVALTRSRSLFRVKEFCTARNCTWTSQQWPFTRGFCNENAADICRPKSRQQFCASPAAETHMDISQDSQQQFCARMKNAAPQDRENPPHGAAFAGVCAAEMHDGHPAEHAILKRFNKVFDFLTHY